MPFGGGEVGASAALVISSSTCMSLTSSAGAEGEDMMDVARGQALVTQGVGDEVKLDSSGPQSLMQKRPRSRGFSGRGLGKLTVHIKAR